MGDGAELVVNSMQGGVLHPPGFPLQGWLGQLFGLLPWGNATERVSLLSLLATTGSLLCLLECGLALGLSAGTRMFASLLYVTSPAVWYLGVQPEVFSLALFLLSLQYLLFLRKYAVEWQALVFALGLAQHPLGLFGLPFLIRPAWRKEALRGVAVVFPVVALAYISLIWQNRGQAWPNWGDLQNLAGVWKHATRQEYGAFSLTNHRGEVVLNALGVFLSELAVYWPVVFIVIPAGFAFDFFRRRKNRKKESGAPFLDPFFRRLLIQFLLVLIFLWRSGVTYQNGHSEAILVRFIGFGLLPCALLLAKGLQIVADELPHSRARGFALAALAAIFIFLLPARLELANARQDTTQAIFHQAVSEAIPSPALVIARTDDEGFAGFGRVPNERFAVLTGMLEQDWYRVRTLVKFYPYLNPPTHWDGTQAAKFLPTLYANRVPIFSTDVRYLGFESRHIARRGLGFLLDSRLNEGFDETSLRSVLALCPWVKRLPALPTAGRPFSRVMFDDFALAFVDLARFLELRQKAAPRAAAIEVARALSDGNARGEAASACDRLAASLGSQL